MDNRSQKLERCSYCGFKSEKIEYQIYTGGFLRHMVGCQNCVAEVKSDPYNGNMLKLVQEWRKRIKEDDEKSSSEN